MTDEQKQARMKQTIIRAMKFIGIPVERYDELLKERGSLENLYEYMKHITYPNWRRIVKRR